MNANFGLPTGFSRGGLGNGAQLPIPSALGHAPAPAPGPAAHMLALGGMGGQFMHMPSPQLHGHGHAPPTPFAGHHAQFLAPAPHELGFAQHPHGHGHGQGGPGPADFLLRGPPGLAHGQAQGMGGMGMLHSPALGAVPGFGMGMGMGANPLDALAREFNVEPHLVEALVQRLSAMR
jgi:hypothetical protein